MKKIIFFTVINFTVLNFSFGQNLEKYSQYVEEAWNLYENKKYKESADKYKEAFDQVDGKAYKQHRYDAACSFALAGDTENAFFHLFYLAEKITRKYDDLDHILNDSDLNSLQNDIRWNELIEKIKANKAESEKKLDKQLISILDSIYEEDQSYRLQISEIENKFGRNSEEMNNHWKIINQKDSINLIKVQKILDNRGWLSPEIIGDKGSLTLFLVIQHSNLETQEKYLPMMREAVNNGYLQPSSLALLEDRIALRNGHKQKYGSQIGYDESTNEYYVLPLEDPENVDIRRKSVGLQNLQNYISEWNIIWNVEDYKKRLPKYEEKLKSK